MNEQPKTLGEHIRQARKRAGFSQRQLATLAGIHHSRLARIENGEIGNRPTPEHLQSIADVLEIDVGELLAYLGIKQQAMLAPRVYFRRAYGLNDAEAQEAEQRIADIIENLRDKNRDTK